MCRSSIREKKKNKKKKKKKKNDNSGNIPPHIRTHALCAPCVRAAAIHVCLSRKLFGDPPQNLLLRNGARVVVVDWDQNGVL